MKDQNKGQAFKTQRGWEGYFYLFGFVMTIPAANWFVEHVGTVCSDSGPCLIPVAPGLMAPSGVIMIGLALILRDLVQRRLGTKTAIFSIIAGALISAFFANPALVIASILAFLLSEFADLLVYTPLQRRRLILAVFASGCVGLVIDSVVFLYLAFGNLEFLYGQIIGKTWVIILSLPAIFWFRNRDERLGIEPA